MVEGVGFFVLGEELEEVRRWGGVALGVVGGGPAAVGLGGGDVGEAAGLHVAGGDEAFGVLGVDFGPVAGGAGARVTLRSQERASKGLS